MSASSVDVFAAGHLGELTQYLPVELVDDVLEQTKTTQRRLRALPSRVGVYFVLALGMFPQLGYLRVWDKLTAGLRHLDRTVIADGKVEPYAALFAPDVRGEIRDQPQHRIRIAPGYVLLDVPVKVKGDLTVESGKKDEIVIRANYSLVYAFTPDHSAVLSDPMDILTVVRMDRRLIFRDGGTFAPGSRGLWPGGGEGHVYSAGCAASRQGMLAPAYSDRGGTGPDTTAEDRERMFDPAKPAPAGSDC